MFREIRANPHGIWARQALKMCNSDFNGKWFQKRYTIIPKVPDGNCSEIKEIKAISSELSNYPTFIYNHQTGEKSCFHNIEKEMHHHGRTARKGGTWN